MIIAGSVIIAISWIPRMLGEAFRSIYPNSSNPETLMFVFAQGYFPPISSDICLTAMGMSTVATCYVATSEIVTENIYLDFIIKNPDPKKLLFFFLNGLFG